MAKGYVQLRRGIEDHLDLMTGTELKVYIKLLIRATFKGNVKGRVRISITNLAEELNLSRQNTNMACRRLQVLKYIKYKKGANQYRDTEFEITKFDKMPVISERQATGQATLHPTVHPTVQAPCNQMPDLQGEIDPLECRRMLKKNTNVFSCHFALAEYLFEKILLNDSKSKKPNFENWAEDIEKLIRIDGRTEEEIRGIIEFCQNDSFWKSNILSAKKLREKFSQLKIRKEANGKSSGNSQRHQVDSEPGKYAGIETVVSNE